MKWQGGGCTRRYLVITIPVRKALSLCKVSIKMRFISANTLEKGSII